MAFIIQYLALRKHVYEQVRTVVGDDESVPTRVPNESDVSTLTEADMKRESEPSKTCNPAFCQIPGITLEVDRNGEQYYQVGWDGPADSFNPRQWSNLRRSCSTLLVCLIALVATMASAIDAAILTEAMKEFGVSDVVESMATGLYLVGFGAGALASSPLSEMVGRYPVYLGTLVIFGAWLLGAALAPNIGAQLAFRFLAGMSGSAPLTVAGGSISDVWSTLEKTFGFPMFAIPGFGGPVLGMFLLSFFQSFILSYFLKWEITNTCPFLVLCRTRCWGLYRLQPGY